MLWLVFIDLIVSFCINVLFGKLYEIKVNSTEIEIENNWSKVKISLEQLDDIRLIRFIFYYPINPYMKFVFKNGKAYTATIPNRGKKYLAPGGIEQYIADLKAELIRAK